MITPRATHLRLVPFKPTGVAVDGSTPDDATIADLIAAARAWSRTTMPIDDYEPVPLCRHLRLVPPPD